MLILLLASSSAFGQDTSYIWRSDRITHSAKIFEWPIFITSKTLEEYVAYCYADSFRIPARQVPLSKRRGKKVVYAHREPTFADFINWLKARR